jgi:hypothetical protein
MQVWVVWFWIGVWVWFITIPIAASWQVRKSVGRCIVKGWHRGFWFFWASVSVIDWIVEGRDASADRGDSEAGASLLVQKMLLGQAEVPKVLRGCTGV